MIARACLTSGLPPSAFGVDADATCEVGEEMLELLASDASKQRSEDLMGRLRQKLGRR